MLSPRYVDPRGHLELQAALERAGFERKALVAGDVQFPEAGGGTVLIEYKDVYQVIADMASGQLAKQCRRMVENADFSLLVLGGAFNVQAGELVGTPYTWNHLWDQLLSCQEYGVMLERCVDQQQAINRILHLADRYAKPEHSAQGPARHPSGNLGVSVLGHIEGVGSKLGYKLLDEFNGQLAGIAAADEARLQQADGVGPKLARRVFSFWRHDWRNGGVH